MSPLARSSTLLPLPALCGALLVSLSYVPTVRAQTTSTTWAQSYGVASYDANGTAGPDPSASTSGADTPTSVGAMPDGGFVVAGELALPELWLRPPPAAIPTPAGRSCATHPTATS